MAFVKYTEQQILQASEVDIADILRRRGEKVKTAGSECEWEHGGDTIRIRGGKWFNFYENEGGNAISFVRKFFEKSFPEAMQFLIGDSAGEIKQAKPKPQKEKTRGETAAIRPQTVMNRTVRVALSSQPSRVAARVPSSRPEIRPFS